jgi:hypothetical protein
VLNMTMKTRLLVIGIQLNRILELLKNSSFST